MGVVPLLLIRHHEAAEQIPFNVGLGEGRLGDAVNLGSNGVAAGVGVVGGLEAHGVQRVEAHHGGAAADGMVAHVAGAHFIVAHVHEEAGAAGVGFFDAPADDVQIRGLAGQVAGDLDPEIGVTEHGAVVDLHLAVGAIEAAVPGHHEGIDFKRLAVVLLVELGQFGEERSELGEVCRSNPGLGADIDGVVGLEAILRIDVQPEQQAFVNAFDVHAAFRAEHQHGAAGFAGVVDDE